MEINELINQLYLLGGDDLPDINFSGGLDSELTGSGQKLLDFARMAEKNKTRFPKPKEYVAEQYLEKYKEFLKKYPGQNGLLKPIITIDDIPEKLKYISNLIKTIYMQMFRLNIHNGQRKLFLSEYQHLTEMLNSHNEEAYVIYAGSAPSNKAPMLGRAFPNVKFIFIDPNEFNFYVSKFHDSHYYYPDTGNVVYMSVSTRNKRMYRLDYGVKKLIHFKNPKEVLNVSDIKSPLSWDNDDEFIEFIENSKYQFYLLEEYYTTAISDLLNKLIQRQPGKKVLFWSDIRSQFYERSVKNAEAGAGDIDVIANAAMTYSWIKHLVKGRKHNFHSMLKFRFVYGDEPINWKMIGNFIREAKELGHDFQEEYLKTGKISFFPGDVYLQAWPGGLSTETRLWSDLSQLKGNLKQYNVQDYEDRLNCYNQTFRTTRYFENPLAGEIAGLDNCNDCALEVSIRYNYYNKFFHKMSDKEKKEKILHDIEIIGNLTGRGLVRYPHGKLFYRSDN